MAGQFNLSSGYFLYLPLGRAVSFEGRVEGWLMGSTRQGVNLVNFSCREIIERPPVTN